MKRSTFVTFCAVLAFHVLALVGLRMGTAVAPLPMEVASYELVLDSHAAPQTVPDPETPKFNPSPREPIALLELSTPEIRSVLPESIPLKPAQILSKNTSTMSQPFPLIGRPLKSASAAARGKPPLARNKTTVSRGPTTAVRPRYLSNPRPVYPTESRRMRQEGQTLLTVKVSAQGRVVSVALKQSSGFPLLDQAAITTVRGWTFDPAQVRGMAVASEIEVPIRFRALR